MGLLEFFMAAQRTSLWLVRSRSVFLNEADFSWNVNDDLIADSMLGGENTRSDVSFCANSNKAAEMFLRCAAVCSKLGGKYEKSVRLLKILERLVNVSDDEDRRYVRAKMREV